MIKDVMVRLDGTPGDDVRLAVVNQIADVFESHITGLFFNVLSSIVPDGRAGAGQAGKLLDTAKQADDIIDAMVFERLTRSQHLSNLRRFDVTGDGDISDTTLPLARAVDVFVALRPNGQSDEPRGLIESLLFGTGRAIAEEDEIADALMAECRKLNANLLVMGSYGHSRLHELLPGSTTDRVLHRSPFPLLIAH